ncbi:hypothetical protein DL769_004166 [Monosporascus sp. CRB-8-3]|nr:hypothetical protein DL769_004166 [Monosporascus sp. CRB-8-3]
MVVLKIILPGAILFAIGAALQRTAQNLTQFIVGRALGGFGQGMFLANIAVYITEVAPSQRRGRLSRYPIQGIIVIMLALSCLILPESPRWLALRGGPEEAVLALRMLDFNMDEARGFLSVAQQQPSLSGWQNFALLLRRNYRPRTLLALFLLGSKQYLELLVQLGGIDAITYFTNWLLALITPILLDASAFGMYFIFGGLALCTTGVLAAHMPETRGRSLENIQEAFHRPAISSVARYLRPLIPSLRHRVVNNSANREIEMERQNQTGPAEAISISHSEPLGA